MRLVMCVYGKESKLAKMTEAEKRSKTLVQT